MSIGPAAVTAASRTTEKTSLFIPAAMPPGDQVCSLGMRRSAFGKPRLGRAEIATGGDVSSCSRRAGDHHRGGATTNAFDEGTGSGAGPASARRTLGGRDVPAAKRCIDDATLVGRDERMRPIGGPGRRSRSAIARPIALGCAAASWPLIAGSAARLSSLIRRCSGFSP
jgi:hypothetical protein